MLTMDPVETIVQLHRRWIEENYVVDDTAATEEKVEGGEMRPPRRFAACSETYKGILSNVECGSPFSPLVLRADGEIPRPLVCLSLQDVLTATAENIDRNASSSPSAVELTRTQLRQAIVLCANETCGLAVHLLPLTLGKFVRRILDAESSEKGLREVVSSVYRTCVDTAGEGGDRRGRQTRQLLHLNVFLDGDRTQLRTRDDRDAIEMLSCLSRFLPSSATCATETGAHEQGDRDRRCAYDRLLEARADDPLRPSRPPVAMYLCCRRRAQVAFVELQRRFSECRVVNASCPLLHEILCRLSGVCSRIRSNTGTYSIERVALTPCAGIARENANALEKPMVAKTSAITWLRHPDDFFRRLVTVLVKSDGCTSVSQLMVQLTQAVFGMPEGTRDGGRERGMLALIRHFFNRFSVRVIFYLQELRADGSGSAPPFLFLQDLEQARSDHDAEVRWAKSLTELEDDTKHFVENEWFPKGAKTPDVRRVVRVGFPLQCHLFGGIRSGSGGDRVMFLCCHHRFRTSEEVTRHAKEHHGDASYAPWPQTFPQQAPSSSPCSLAETFRQSEQAAYFDIEDELPLLTRLGLDTTDTEKLRTDPDLHCKILEAMKHIAKNNKIMEIVKYDVDESLAGLRELIRQCKGGDGIGGDSGRKSDGRLEGALHTVNLTLTMRHRFRMLATRKLLSKETVTNYQAAWAIALRRKEDIQDQFLQRRKLVQQAEEDAKAPWRARKERYEKSKQEIGGLDVGAIGRTGAPATNSSSHDLFKGYGALIVQRLIDKSSNVQNSLGVDCPSNDTQEAEQKIRAAETARTRAEIIASASSSIRATMPPAAAAALSRAGMSPAEIRAMATTFREDGRDDEGGFFDIDGNSPVAAPVQIAADVDTAELRRILDEDAEGKEQRENETRPRSTTFDIGGEEFFAAAVDENKRRQEGARKRPLQEKQPRDVLAWKSLPEWRRPENVGGSAGGEVPTKRQKANGDGENETRDRPPLRPPLSDSSSEIARPVLYLWKPWNRANRETSAKAEMATTTLVDSAREYVLDMKIMRGDLQWSDQRLRERAGIALDPALETRAKEAVRQRKWCDTLREEQPLYLGRPIALRRRRRVEGASDFLLQEEILPALSASTTEENAFGKQEQTEMETTDARFIRVPMGLLTEGALLVLDVIESISHLPPEDKAVRFASAVYHALCHPFGLSMVGGQVLVRGTTDAVIAALGRERSTNTSEEETETTRHGKRLWLLFARIVEMLNSNGNGRLNALFRKRYHRPGDPFKVAVRVHPEEAYEGNAPPVQVICAALKGNFSLEEQPSSSSLVSSTGSSSGMVRAPALVLSPSLGWATDARCDEEARKLGRLPCCVCSNALQEAEFGGWPCLSRAGSLSAMLENTGTTLKSSRSAGTGMPPPVPPDATEAELDMARDDIAFGVMADLMCGVPGFHLFHVHCKRNWSDARTLEVALRTKETISEDGNISSDFACTSECPRCLNSLPQPGECRQDSGGDSSSGSSNDCSNAMAKTTTQALQRILFRVEARTALARFLVAHPRVLLDPLRLDDAIEERKREQIYEENRHLHDELEMLVARWFAPESSVNRRWVNDPSFSASLRSSLERQACIAFQRSAGCSTSPLSLLPAVEVAAAFSLMPTRPALTAADVKGATHAAGRDEASRRRLANLCLLDSQREVPFAVSDALDAKKRSNKELVPWVSVSEAGARLLSIATSAPEVPKKAVVKAKRALTVSSSSKLAAAASSSSSLFSPFSTSFSTVGSEEEELLGGLSSLFFSSTRSCGSTHQRRTRTASSDAAIRVATSPEMPSPASGPCHCRGCGACRYMEPGSNDFAGERLHSSGINCGSKGIVFVVVCSDCDYRLVEYAQGTLRSRIAAHEQRNTRRNHFFAEGHRIRVIGLERCADPRTGLLASDRWSQKRAIAVARAKKQERERKLR